MQVIGKVIDGTILDVKLVAPVNDDFDMNTYNEAIELSHGQYRNMFM